MATTQGFSGSKVALFIGDKLLILLRDDLAHIPCPNMWDLPGGAREGLESPFETLAREVHEEVGLVLDRSAIVWRRRYPAMHGPGDVWFFVGQMPASSATDIVFGDEGQGWGLVTQEAFLKLDQVVPSFAPRLRDWIADGGTLTPPRT